MDPLIAFVDVDYLRASRAAGSRHVTTSGPETWLVDRIGIVWAAAGTAGIEVVDAQLIGGSTPVTDTINALARASLVVGAGLLTGDMRALSMVYPLTDRLLDRTVDITLDLYELSGQRYPTGFNLSDLSSLNLAEQRLKPHDPTPAVSEMSSGLSGGRGDFLPLDDAMTAAQVWAAVLVTGRVRWGGRRPGWTGSHDGAATWEAAEPQAALLDKATEDRLKGSRPLGSTEWRRRVSERGQVFTRAPMDLAAAELARQGQQLPHLDLSPLRRCAEALPDHDGTPVPNERLLAAFQLLGPASNLQARKALSDGRFLSSHRRLADYMFALWRVCHMEVYRRWETIRTTSWTTSADYARHQQMKQEASRVHGSCSVAARPLCTRKPQQRRAQPAQPPIGYDRPPGFDRFIVDPDGTLQRLGAAAPPAPTTGRLSRRPGHVEVEIQPGEKMTAQEFLRRKGYDI